MSQYFLSFLKQIQYPSMTFISKIPQTSMFGEYKHIYLHDKVHACSSFSWDKEKWYWIIQALIKWEQ